MCAQWTTHHRNGILGQAHISMAQWCPRWVCVYVCFFPDDSLYIVYVSIATNHSRIKAIFLNFFIYLRALGTRSMYEDRLPMVQTNISNSVEPKWTDRIGDLVMVMMVQCRWLYGVQMIDDRSAAIQSNLKRFSSREQKMSARVFGRSRALLLQLSAFGFSRSLSLSNCVHLAAST